MIVRCIDNLDSSVPKAYRDLAPDSVSEEILACSPHKVYAVYAIKHDKQRNIKWYFIYTDNGYLWWMPEVLFEIVQSQYPENWQIQDNKTHNVLISYPSLNNWNIEEGIIDGDNRALNVFLNEVQSDPTFPLQEKTDNLNADFNRQSENDQYQKDLALAKENGWERPKKPED